MSVVKFPVGERHRFMVNCSGSISAEHGCKYMAKAATDARLEDLSQSC
jgi:hypothetical protein